MHLCSETIELRKLDRERVMVNDLGLAIISIDQGCLYLNHQFVNNEWHRAVKEHRVDKLQLTTSGWFNGRLVLSEHNLLSVRMSLKFIYQFIYVLSTCI